jgi:DNA-binding PadR family transcriptional regulator
MEKDGLIASRWIVSDGGRYRKYYKITNGGLAELESEMAQWRRVTEAMAKLCRPLFEVRG